MYVKINLIFGGRKWTLLFCSWSYFSWWSFWPVFSWPWKSAWSDVSCSLLWWPAVQRFPIFWSPVELHYRFNSFSYEPYTTRWNTLREFLKLSRPLHSVSVVAKQAPLALSNAKVSCKHGLWLVARVNKRGISYTSVRYPLLFIHSGLFLSPTKIHG